MLKSIKNYLQSKDEIEFTIFCLIIATALLIFATVLLFVFNILTQFQLETYGSLISALLALGTFYMVRVTYRAYKTLIAVQKASHEPHLSIEIKPFGQVITKLSGYNLTIKNNGPGIAINTKLSIKFKIINKNKEKTDYNFKFKIGTIGVTDTHEMSIPSGVDLKKIDKRVTCSVTCQDIFNKSKPIYGDEKILIFSEKK